MPLRTSDSEHVIHEVPRVQHVMVSFIIRLSILIVTTSLNVVPSQEVGKFAKGPKSRPI